MIHVQIEIISLNKYIDDAHRQKHPILDEHNIFYSYVHSQLQFNILSECQENHELYNTCRYFNNKVARKNIYSMTKKKCMFFCYFICSRDNKENNTEHNKRNEIDR